VASLLETFRAHCYRMAGTSSVPASEAALWLQMVDEIDAYLAHAGMKEFHADVTPDDQPLEGM